METEARVTKKKSKAKLLHQYYSYTGFYSFIGQSMMKALPAILVFGLIIFLVDYFIVDIPTYIISLTESLSATGIFSIFLSSETLLGLIPPEIFITWSLKTVHPLMNLFILALCSYIGGGLSFYIGRGILALPSIHKHVEGKMAVHIKNIRKWGGFMIVVGALLPIPFSMTSLAAGFISYEFKNYLLFGLLRFVRFAVFGVAIFSMI